MIKELQDIDVLNYIDLMLVDMISITIINCNLKFLHKHGIFAFNICLFASLYVVY